MYFKFTVEVEAERTEGKFASRDELQEQIQEALESADPGQLDGENGGMYETTNWEVRVIRLVRASERRRSDARHDDR